MTRSAYYSAIVEERNVSDLNIFQADLNILQCKLRQIFENKKYLLVIDGYMNQSSYDWKKFILPFTFGKAGSTILITTQSSKVVSVVGSQSTYSLKPLNYEVCWSIMKEFAFSRDNMGESEQFACIGKQIAKKSCGLPLLAVALGSMLSLKSNLNFWESISKSDLWKLSQLNSHVLSLFVRSYSCLPAELKICFVYSTLLPPNRLFKMDDLVRLWVAEGFIQHVAEISAEQIGRDYFMDLVSLFVFQVVELTEENPHYQRLTVYKMHRIFGGLGKMLSEGICVRLEEKTPNWESMLRKAHHVSIDQSVMDMIEPKKFKKKSSLRTFMVVDKRHSQAKKDSPGRITIPFAIIEKMDFLRVLYLCGCGVDELPKSVGLLEHLRYLNVSNNPITMIPDEVCNLFSLLTLKLKNCIRLEELPKDISKLVNLHELDIDIDKLKVKPSNLGKLTALQFLEEFILGTDEGCRIEELGTMNLLGGSLTISNLENVQGCEDTFKAQLCDKPYINVLKLSWNSALSRNSADYNFVLDGLQPHPNLQELWISNFYGDIFPAWMDEKMPLLSSIHLNNIPNCKSLPWLWQHPSLQSIYIGKMNRLSEIRLAISSDVAVGFPRLKSITFSSLPEFAKWDFNDIDLPCLTDLTFEHCPMFPSLPIGKFVLKRLVISKCDILKSRCSKDGEDWHIVQYIQEVKIDDVRIQ